MYYEIKRILEEHLPPTVGVLDFAHVLKTYVKPELEDYFVETKTELIDLIRDEKLALVLTPEKGKQLKNNINKEKLEKEVILKNLFCWFKLQNEYVMDNEEFEIAIDSKYEFEEDELIRYSDYVKSLNNKQLFKLEIKEKYKIYREILTEDKYEEYITEAMEIALKIQDKYKVIEIVISNIDVLLNQDDSMEDIFDFLVDLYIDNKEYNKLYKQFNEFYTPEDYDIIRMFRAKEKIENLNVEHLKKYNNYINFDTNMKFINDNVNIDNYMYIDKELLLKHKQLNKLNIEIKILIFGKDFIISNNMYKSVDLKYLIDETNYHMLDEKGRKYVNEFGILTEELVDIIAYEELVKNKSLTKELLNYIARDNEELDLSKIKLQFTFEDLFTYPNIEKSIMNQKLTTKQLEQGYLNYAKLDIKIVIKSKKLIAEYVKCVEIDKIVELFNYVDFRDVELSKNTYYKLVDHDIEFLYQMLDNNIVAKNVYRKHAKLVLEYNPQIYQEVFGDKSLKDVNPINRNIKDLVVNFENISYNSIIKIVEYNSDTLLEQKQDLNILLKKVIKEYGSSASVAIELKDIVDKLENISVSDPEIEELKKMGIIFIKRNEADALAYIDYNTSLISLKSALNMFEDVKRNYKLNNVDFRDLQLAGNLSMVYNQALRDMIELFEHQLHCYINYQYKYYCDDRAKSIIFNYELNGQNRKSNNIEEFLNHAGLGDLTYVYNELYASSNTFIGNIPLHINDIRNKVYHHSFTLQRGSTIFDYNTLTNYISDSMYTLEENEYYSNSIHCREVVELLNFCYYFLSRSSLLEFRKKKFNEDIISTLNTCIDYYNKTDQVDKWVVIHMQYLLKTTNELCTFDFDSINSSVND